MQCCPELGTQDRFLPSRREHGWEYLQLGISKEGRRAGRKISLEPQCQPKWQGIDHFQDLTSHFPISLDHYLSVRCHTMSAKTRRKKEELLYHIHLTQLST